MAEVVEVTMECEGVEFRPLRNGHVSRIKFQLPYGEDTHAELSRFNGKRVSVTIEENPDQGDLDLEDEEE